LVLSNWSAPAGLPWCEEKTRSGQWLVVSQFAAH
jgi:hypothetical protein